MKAMLLRYFNLFSARISDTCLIRIRIRYGAGAYQIRHVIILFRLTGGFGLQYALIRPDTPHDTLGAFLIRFQHYRRSYIECNIAEPQLIL
jgi:hypothetical protein